MSFHLERQLAKVRRLIAMLGDRVEDLVKDAVESVQTGDKGMAVRTIARDSVIDELEVDVEEECLHTLALYQPVAMDLRYVVAVLKMNSDMERIADQACNIAEQASFLADEDPIDLRPYNLETMAEKVLSMLANAIEAVMRADAAIADGVRAADDEVDTIHRHMYEHVIFAVRKDPAHAAQHIHAMIISRQLERIADLACNIAEDVIYMAKGKILRHADKAHAFED